MFNASLIDIARQAGQRNRAALYHFGLRDGILCAVIDRHAEFLARRESDLLAVAKRVCRDRDGITRCCRFAT